MNLVKECAIVLAFIVGLELISYALKRDFLGLGLFRLRTKLARQLPVGHHGPSPDARCSVGKPDDIVVIRMPLPDSTGTGVTMYQGITGPSTAFWVEQRPVDVDGFLEAYDDEIGPISVEICQPGVIANARIDRREAAT